MDFEFCNPTHHIFGAGKLSQLGEVTGRYGKKALIVTGGGGNLKRISPGCAPDRTSQKDSVPTTAEEVEL